MARDNGENVTALNCNMPGDGPHKLDPDMILQLTCEQRYHMVKDVGLSFVAVERFVMDSDLACPHLFDYTIMIRHPIDRFHSHQAYYGHTKKIQEVDMIGTKRIKKGDRTLKSAVQEAMMENVSYYGDNYLTRHLLGLQGLDGTIDPGSLTIEHKEMAKRQLDVFSHILCLEQFDTHIVQLVEGLGWKRRIQHANKSTRVRPLSDDDDDLTKRNAFDLELYQYGCDRANKLSADAKQRLDQKELK
jgi:hypothetical protein